MLAACAQAPDPTIFDWQDAEDLGGVHNSKVRALNEVRFAEAKLFCDTCPVVAECDAEGKLMGDTSWSIRGGLSPYDRTERVGYPVGLEDAKRRDASAARERAWQRYMEGESTERLSASGRRAVDARRRALVEDTEPDCSWDDFSHGYNTGGRPWKAGSGWAISQDRTRSVVMILKLNPSGKISTRFANTQFVRYDDVSTPKVLRDWPEGVDVVTSR